MNDKEKAKEIAQNFRTARMFSKHPCEIAEDAARQMAEWKDQQFKEEKKELLELVNMLKVDETNQTIIGDLKSILQ